MEIESSSSRAMAMTAMQAPAAMREVAGERENDGDRDDMKAAAPKPAGPTVNMNGQMVGGKINVTA